MNASFDTFGDEYASLLSDEARVAADSAATRALRDERAGRVDAEMVDGRLKTTGDEPVHPSMYKQRDDHEDIYLQPRKTAMNEVMMRGFYDQLQKSAMTTAFFQELDKIASTPSPRDWKEKALMGIDKARPYAYRAAMGAVPGAVMGNIFGGKRGAFVGAGIGAGVGLADRHLEDLSDKNRRMRKLLSSYKEQLR